MSGGFAPHGTVGGRPWPREDGASLSGGFAPRPTGSGQSHGARTFGDGGSRRCDPFFATGPFYLPLWPSSYDLTYAPSVASGPDYDDAYYFVDQDSDVESDSGIAGYENSDERGDTTEGENEADVWLRLGDVFFAQGEFERAAEAYRKSVDSAPDAALPHIALGEALFAIGQFNEAAAQLRQGIELDPSWVNVDLDRRELYPDPAIFDQRLKSVIAATEQDHFDAAGAFVAAYMLFFTHNAGDARPLFERVKEILSEDATSELFLSCIAERSGENR
ncbi:MAG: tetratricopeptide repeat protein [Planctomycetes bacterium]|nr:tetratricopeptide repeat protein [Planctomycetota bacterium]MBI3846489.1 tetratricopeptide repeat protein [Planctomycetota bacterium]